LSSLLSLTFFDHGSKPLTRKFEVALRCLAGLLAESVRPRSAVHKKPVTVRLDPEIVQFFQASGPGWQTRMNAALAEYVKRRRLRP
jgi:uncharacterized protein (DUF4415 family)